MKKKSLDKKIAFCQQYGSIKTLSLKEAKEFYRGIGLDDDIPLLLARYKMDKYLIGFIANPEFENVETVYQISTVGHFVRNLLYPSILKEVK